MLNTKKMYIVLILLMSGIWLGGCSTSTITENKTSAPTPAGEISWLNLDTVKAGEFDTGKMWTFDFPPKDYFLSEYNMDVTDEWLNKARMSALRFATYCSASFVSADGLVMTNHHCARESVTEVQKEGEDLHANGFFAQTLADERKVPGLFVDQLALIKDVTEDIQKAMDEGKTEDEKIKNRDAKKKELEKKYKDETGLECSVITFYNGGKYSLYGYKRYNDVRLVFAPETQLGFYGGDPDNFTYPRYALDCSFFRVYDENGNPLQTDNYFKWSPNGAKAGEPVFVVGNPGSTNRLKTVSQLEYMRDVQHPVTTMMLEALVNIYTSLVAEATEKKAELQDQLFGYSNSLKAYQGILKGLRDPILMQKKKDFESKFKAKVMANPKLAAQYGHLWDKIAEIRKEIKTYAFMNVAFNPNPISSTQYLTIARGLINYANNVSLPEEKRDPRYQGEGLAKVKETLFPATFDKKMADRYLEFNQRFFSFLLGENDPLVKALTGGKKGKEAVEYCLSKSSITSKEKVMELVEKGPDAILNSDDPFITYMKTALASGKEISEKIKALSSKEADYSQQLGRALFEVYGTSIPPDATFSLRISDGVVKGYDYNGTTAPVVTTFYGLYDRFYSFNKEYPWSLPERWQNPPQEFDLETPMVFVSTNDIIGGNSGSPVVNQKLEVVGLAFDGNIESLPGQFIFTTESNRTVSVHSAGMFEAIQDLYQAKRLSEELKAGKIVSK